MKKRVGAISDLGVGLIIWPVIVLSSVTFFNTNATLSVYFQAALYLAVIAGAAIAGALANITGPTDIGAHWGPQTFILAALGGFWAVATASNLNLFLSAGFGLFIPLYAIMSVSFILGTILWTGQSGGTGT